MSKFFIAIYDFFEKKKAILYIIFTGCFLLMAYGASKLEIKENIFEMLPHDHKSEQLTSFMENSKFSDRIMLVVAQKDTAIEPDPDRLIMLTDSLASVMDAELKNYIRSINYMASDSVIESLLAIFNKNLPVFLDDNDYVKMDSLITDEGIKKKLEYNYQSLIGPAGIGLKKFILNDPLGFNFLAYKKLETFQVSDEIEMYDHHFITKNHRNALVFIDPEFPSAETDKNIEFFKQLDQKISVLSNVNKEYKISYFGAPVVAAGNSQQIRKDTVFTLSLTVIFLLIVILVYFRKLSTPLLVIIPVVFGGLFALFMIWLFKGSVSVISLGAGSLVLGIAINYSLHFLTHFKHHPDGREVIKELASPMTIGSLTTIGGFLCLQFVNAPVLRDLGLYAALSLTGAAIASLIFLPHFVSSSAFSSKALTEHKESAFVSALRKVPTSKYFLWLLVILTPVFLYFAPGVGFESDLYKINYMSPELRKTEAEMNNISSFYQKSIFHFSKGKTLQEALTESEKSLPVLQKMKAAGTIKSFTNVSVLLPSVQEQEKKIAKWQRYWSENKRTEVYAKLIKEGKNYPFKETAFTPFKTITENKFTALSPGDTKTIKETFLNNFIEEKDGQVSLTGLIKTTDEHSAEVYRQLPESENSFVFDRKSLTDKLVNIVNSDFNFITLWTSLLVLIALLLTYGRIELTLITFIPMVVTWIWILGIMAMFGIKFNIINIILSTLIFALGDDFCIFTTDGLQQEYSRKVQNMKALSASITLSAITTVSGMGFLIFAKHPAIHSIGLVSIIGLLSVWLMAEALQPE